MEFSRQEYWSGSPFPSPGALLDPGIESMSLALQADSLPSEPLGKPPWSGRKHPNFTQNGPELTLPSLTPPFSISTASCTLLDKWSARIDPTFYSWDQPWHLLTPLCVVPLPQFTPILISGIPVLISIPSLPACDRALSKKPLILWNYKHRVPWVSQPLMLGFKGLPIQSIEAELLASTSTRRCSRRQPLKYIELKQKKENHLLSIKC